MLTDPLFYLVAIPGVMLYGIAKGGFAGPVAVLAVPMMALAPLGVAIGRRLVKSTDPQLYYRIISFFLIVLGGVLIVEGLRALQ